MSSSLPRIPKIAIRYVGDYTVSLSPASGRHFHTDGRERTRRALHKGDEILVPATDALGYTQYTDPARVQERDYFPEFLGVGLVVKPEHRFAEDGHERSIPELQAIGYEVSEGRPDFIPLNVPDVIVPLRTELPTAEEQAAAASGGPGPILGVHADALNLARGFHRAQATEKLNQIAGELVAKAAVEQGVRRPRRRDPVLEAAAEPPASATPPADAQEQPPAVDVA